MWKIKRTFYNIVVILCIALILVGNYSTYATEMVRDNDTGEVTPKVTQEDAGEAISAFARNFVANYGASTEYGPAWSAYRGIKAGEKYQLNEMGWITFVVHRSLHYGDDNIYRDFISILDSPNVNDNNGFKVELPQNDNNKIKKEDILKKEEVIATVRNGDILVETGGTRLAIYVGGDIIYCDNEGDRPLKQISLFPEDKSEGENSNERRTVFKEYCAIIRFTEEAATGLKTTDITSLFDEEDDDGYGKYYGTTQGSYVGSTNHGLKWLFSKMLGFVDYLFGIMALLIRAPFVGFANIVENMINDNINYISGVSSIRNSENLDLQSQEEKTNVQTYISDRDVYLNNRVNIEDIIYNNVPLLDADLFDVRLSKYDGAIEQDSILYKIRENIAGWYVSIRNVSIVGMLIALIYLGFRIAIATTIESKAKYKEMLSGWITSFIILFFIHYIMIFVLNLNQNIIEWLKVENMQANGGISLYDTVRTRAYSIKLNEGIPATIFYIILIYYLIRFLSIYIKRYLTINILALLGPIIIVRGAIEKISKGKNKSSTFVSWLTDFSLNVLLQTVHALIYTMFMITAYQMAMKSIAGFLVALFYINFIFKAEDIILKVFNFNDARSLGEVVDPKTNYFMETYGLIRGAQYYTSRTLKFGYNSVKNIGKNVVSELDEFSTDIMARMTGSTFEDYKKEQRNTKNELIDGINNIYKGVTGNRSLRLDLVKVKYENPELYDSMKGLLNRNRQQNVDVLKRSLANGIRPIKAMAGLVTSIPLTIDKPDKGILAIYDTISTINRISGNKMESYGHTSKKTIKNRAGRIAVNIATGGTYGIVAENAKQLNKDLKKLRKSEEELYNLKRSNTLQAEISRELIRLKEKYEEDLNKKSDNVGSNDNKKSDSFDAIRTNMLSEAFSSVMYGKDIKSAIKKYMIKNNISQLNEGDVEGILIELNISHMSKEIDRLISSKVLENEELKDQIESLRVQAEKLKEEIKNASAEVIKDEEIETIRKESEKKLTRVTKELTKKQDKIKKSEKEIELIKETEKEIKNAGNLSAGILKDKNIIKNIINQKLKEAKNIDELSAQQIVEEFDKKVKNDELDTYASSDTIKNKFINNNTKGLDKKKATNAILDSIFEDGNKKIEEETSSKYGQFGEYKKMIKKMRELQTLNEKNKNVYNKSIINFYDYTRKMKKGGL